MRRLDEEAIAVAILSRNLFALVHVRVIGDREWALPQVRDLALDGRNAPARATVATGAAHSGHLPSTLGTGSC